MIPPLIAHRGEPVSWPENSLAGYQAVLEAGAAYIETDVQITSDGIAVLSHDASSLKITGSDLLIPETDYVTLRGLSAGYPERFGNRHQDLVITRLDELVDLLQDRPDCRVFIELKQASLTAHGHAAVVDTVMSIIGSVLSQVVLIAFSHDALVHVHHHHPGQSTGWILPEWSDSSRQQASELAPDYLFVNRTRLPHPAVPLWSGPWQWVVYTVNHADEVSAFLDHGFHLVETDEISRLLLEPHLADAHRD